MKDRTRPSFLILGAGSDIGRALSKVAAAAGCSLVLAARNSSQLDGLADYLRTKHAADVSLSDFDVLDTDGHATFLDELPVLPDIAICLVGLLGDQASAEHNFPEAELILRTNLIGPLSILSEIADRMESADVARSSG
jgi:decaprenylphospho-beta-D-erythro-pentofuranosid-2-ulose 2-reductase